jgi:hypothetical protein
MVRLVNRDRSPRPASAWEIPVLRVVSGDRIARVTVAIGTALVARRERHLAG